MYMQSTTKLKSCAGDAGIKHIGSCLATRLVVLPLVLDVDDVQDNSPFLFKLVFSTSG